MWNNFEWSATNIFRQLWISPNFTDFTLARADECQMKAHKVILSPHSDFLKHILLKKFHKSHLVYLVYKAQDIYDGDAVHLLWAVWGWT